MKRIIFSLQALFFTFSTFGQAKNISSDVSINLIAVGFECNADKLLDSIFLFDPWEMFIEMEVINNSADTIVFGARNLEYYSMEKLEYGYFEMILNDGDTVGLYTTQPYFELAPGDYLPVSSRYEDRHGKCIINRFRTLITDSYIEKVKGILQGCQIIYYPLSEDYRKESNRFSFIDSVKIINNENFYIFYTGWMSGQINSIQFDFQVGDVSKNYHERE